MKTALLISRQLSGPTYYEALRNALAELGTTHLLHGAEGAAKAHAQAWAAETGNPETGYAPDWNEHGRAAGPIRGRELIKAADNVVAIWDGQSKGTANELREARRQGKRVKLILTR
ncbi:TIR domain-containing protein [Spirosoma sordidisoli]|uniref:DUF2493 domain-containing protein n=1 Tax=Spirosoma sordidisoli TaxID=2502893 RepID=A0A4Q2UTF0_9BACT|nr:DUF2493 domain-containing protein [Spirosoma sordidisoli]RYC70089.1 DUF2493 domain-containing protein [Spirosoma sordidisoli]